MSTEIRETRYLLVEFEEMRVAEDWDGLLAVSRVLLERLDELNADFTFVLLLNLEIAYHNLFKRDGSGLARDVFDGLRPNRDTGFMLAGLYHLAYEALVREKHGEMERASLAREIVQDNRPFAHKNGSTMAALRIPQKAPLVWAAWERVTPIEQKVLERHFVRLQPESPLGPTAPAAVPKSVESTATEAAARREGGFFRRFFGS